MTETFEQYTARILSLAEGHDAFTVLESTPQRIGAMLARRTREDLRWSTSPSRWSVAEIVTHLADAEIVFAYRVRMMLSAPGTPIQAYDQNAWSRAQHAERSDAHASLSLFASIRASMLRLLKGLTDEELDRYGMHAERGKRASGT